MDKTENNESQKSVKLRPTDGRHHIETNEAPRPVRDNGSASLSLLVTAAQKHAQYSSLPLGTINKNNNNEVEPPLSSRRGMQLSPPPLRQFGAGSASLPPLHTIYPIPKRSRIEAFDHPNAPNRPQKGQQPDEASSTSTESSNLDKDSSPLVNGSEVVASYSGSEPANDLPKPSQDNKASKKMAGGKKSKPQTKAEPENAADEAYDQQAEVEYSFLQRKIQSALETQEVLSTNDKVSLALEVLRARQLELDLAQARENVECLLSRDKLPPRVLRSVVPTNAISGLPINRWIESDQTRITLRPTPNDPTAMFLTIDFFNLKL